MNTLSRSGRGRQDGPSFPRYRVALWVTVLAIALLYALWYGNAREGRALTAGVRQELGGTYVELEDGVTHFSIEGPYDGPLFILVHGATMGMFVWDDLAGSLASAGFQVLRYDAYGRGYSDRPDADYTLDFSVRQLEEIVERFSNDRPVHLAGVSVGGLVSAAYAARHPDRVERVTLISPAVRGIPAVRGPAAWVARTPGLGEFAMRVFGMNRLEARARGMLEEYPENGRRMADPFLEQMRYRGYERAMLAVMRGDLLRDQRAAYAMLGETDVPVQVLWGKDDSEISAQDMAILRKAVPDVTFRAVPGAGHGLLVERGDLVSEALTAFHGPVPARDEKVSIRSAR
ncbi:MAG: alpha/beta fold hydrolase [Alphaproteobacteria bacterium]